MAKFKTHMGWGVFLGVGLVVADLIYSIFSGAESAILIFMAVLVGSFLPDLDLDESVPFQILFGLLGAGLAGLVFFHIYQRGDGNLLIIVMFPALAFGVIRFGLGYIFEKFTRHRGIFHSIPAAVLFGLLTIWLLHLFSIAKGQELIVGIAVTVGYLGHLILDEIYSTTDFKGHHALFPKKSLGSALKLTSSSTISTIIFYCLLFFLAVTLPETRGFF